MSRFRANDGSIYHSRLGGVVDQYANLCKDYLRSEYKFFKGLGVFVSAVSPLAVPLIFATTSHYNDPANHWYLEKINENLPSYTEDQTMAQDK